MTNDPNDFSWLDAPLVTTAALKARPEYAEALLALRALRPTQRLFLDCLIDSQLEPDDARKLLKERHGIVVSRKTVNRQWIEGDPNFRAALTKLQEFAAGGLAVNLICIWLLRPTGAQAMRNDPDGDLNLSAAHLHLTADAAVSVLALGAMLAGQTFGWDFADPLAGLVGAVLVGHFAVQLMRRSAATLLDINPSAELTAEVRARLSAQGERVVDLHLWRLGPGHHAAIAVLAAPHPQPAAAYHARLKGLAGLSHVTVEVREAGDSPHPHGHSHD